jgi:enoyl-CoA hydratase
MITLTMKAPGKNALSTELMTWIIERLEEARGEAVLLTGDGDAFSAGLNLKEVASLDREGMSRFLGTLERMVEALFHHAGPTVAWLNGHAIAGGCVVALACDHRLASGDPRTRIGLNEIPLGLRFPPKTWRLVRHRVPSHAIERVVLEGGLYAPDVALRLGLIDEIVSGEAAARAYAERIVAAPRQAYVAAKEALRRGVLDVGPDEERAFRDDVLPAWVTPELQARLAAVLKGK